MEAPNDPNGGSKLPEWSRYSLTTHHSPLTTHHSPLTNLNFLQGVVLVVADDAAQEEIVFGLATRDAKQLLHLL